MMHSSTNSGRTGDKNNVEIENPSAKYKSQVWEFFGFPVNYDNNGIRSVDRENTICRRCYQKIKYNGNTTNMITHLSRHHAVLDVTTKRKPVNMTFVSVPTDETGRESPGEVPMVGQLRMQSFLQSPLAPNSARALAITHSIALFIALDLRPLCVVNNRGFQNMVHQLEPRYHIPSRTHFTNNVIPQIYAQTKETLNQKLNEADFVSITTDGWTSRSTQSFMTVTAHFVDSKWNIQSFVLQTRVLNESHTSGILADLLIECAREWKLTRPGTNIPVTTDNARNVVNSVRDAKGFGPNVRCFAHTINLACQKSLQTTTLSRLLGKIRKVVTYFHHSYYGAEVLKSKQAILELPRHSLIIDVSTRWNSTYEMLERYYEQHEAVLLSTSDIKKKNKDLVTLTDDDLNNVKSVAEILKPLQTVTTLLCSEQTPTISIILPLKNKIIESVEPVETDTKILQEVKSAILEDLKPRYTEPELLKFLEESTALDPRFRSLPFSEYENTNFAVYSRIMAKCLQYSKDCKVCDDNETESIALLTDGLDSEEPPKKKTALEELLGDTFSKSTTSTSQLDDLQHEIKTYQEGIKTPLDSSPLLWWAANESQFPQLSLQARKYLGIPGTSVPSERVFSTAGDIVSAQRNCLHPDNVDILIFLKNNFNLS